MSHRGMSPRGADPMMTTRATLSLPQILAAAVCLASPALGNEGRKDLVHWRSQTFAPGDWPVNLPERARVRVDEWAEWASSAGYRIDVDDSARVLHLCLAKFNKSVGREADLVDGTLAAIDDLLGTPAPAPTSAGTVETPVVVLVRLDDADDYVGLLEHVALQRPGDRAFLRAAESLPGVRLWKPSLSAWIEDDLGREEWRADNELVHQLATMLVRARYGEVPHWLETGVAWKAELEVCRSIYCFPGRDGFVSVAEHKGWESALKKDLAKRAEDLTAEDFDAWQRSTWDERHAPLAWGMVTFLAEHRPGRLGPILQDLGSYQGALVKSVSESANAQERPRTAASVQHQVFQRRAGDDVYAECTRFLRTGSRYRPSRR